VVKDDDEPPMETAAAAALSSASKTVHGIRGRHDHAAVPDPCLVVDIIALLGRNRERMPRYVERCRLLLRVVLIYVVVTTTISAGVVIDQLRQAISQQQDQVVVLVKLDQFGHAIIMSNVKVSRQRAGQGEATGRKE
jgi:hypothetical protein